MPNDQNKEIEQLKAYSQAWVDAHMNWMANHTEDCYAHAEAILTDPEEVKRVLSLLMVCAYELSECDDPSAKRFEDGCMSAIVAVINMHLERMRNL